MDDPNPNASVEKDTFDLLTPEREAPLLDMDNFETLEARINSGQYDDSPVRQPPEPKSFQQGTDDFMEFGLGDDFTLPKAKSDSSQPESSPIASDDFSPLADVAAQQGLSIGEGSLLGDDFVPVKSFASAQPHPSPPAAERDLFSGIGDEKLSPAPKIEEAQKPEAAPPVHREVAYQPAAQPRKSQIAMEKEVSSTAGCECPFSPAALLNRNKLHPLVAEYVYWDDPKKSGAALSILMVLLLSFKFFSVISVLSYLLLSLLAVTTTFRLYKSVTQAIQKSDEGHPFKEYLDLDIALSQDKIGESAEGIIHHVNCITGKLRSYILVEDYVDTLKFGALAWVFTYVGSWFNALTLVILGVVTAFTLPKVYELNKAQIDAYAELVRTKAKDVFDMVNAKMPLGKKKKDQ